MGIITSLIDKLGERHATFTGTWDQLIYHPDHPGISVEKHDTVICRQKGDTIQSEIRRVLPEKENGRAWHFVGRYRNDVIFGHFWSTDPKDQSLGTIFLRGVDGNRFKGFYIRLGTVVEDWDKVSVRIQKVPVEWCKISRVGLDNSALEQSKYVTTRIGQ